MAPKARWTCPRGVCVHGLLMHVGVAPGLSPSVKGVLGRPVTVEASGPRLSLASPLSKGLRGFVATSQNLLPLQMGRWERVRGPQNDAFPSSVCIFRCSWILTIYKEKNTKVMDCFSNSSVLRAAGVAHVPVHLC